MVTVATHGPKPKPQPIYPARRATRVTAFWRCILMLMTARLDGMGEDVPPERGGKALRGADAYSPATVCLRQRHRAALH